MKRELNVYNFISGIGEYDEWSYCADDAMWYEDKKEVLPLPKNKSEIVKDLTCKIKVDSFITCGEGWNNAEQEKDLETYARYLLGTNNADDCVSSVVCLRTAQQECSFCFSQYGIWGLEEFADKVKNQPFATQYIEQWSRCKLIAWSGPHGSTRLVIHFYNEDDVYPATQLDITVDREELVSKLKAVVEIWKDTVRNEILKQMKILSKHTIHPDLDFAITHFFPKLVKNSGKLLP